MYKKRKWKHENKNVNSQLNLQEKLILVAYNG